MKSETFTYPMIRLFSALLVLALPVTGASAQESKVGSKVTFSVTRFDPRDLPSPKFVVKNGSRDVEIEVPLTYIAGPFSATLRDDKFLDFFEGGAKVPAISTEIPVAMLKDLLVVFVPAEKGFKLLKIHAPPTALGGGDHYVVNATEADVAIKYGSAKPVLVKPGKSAILHDGAAGKAPTLPVVINRKDGDQWKLVSTENWPNDVRFRNFLFLYKSARDHHMAIHGISERVD